MSISPTPRPLLLWLDGDGLAAHETTAWVSSLLQLKLPMLVLWSKTSSSDDFFQKNVHPRVQRWILPLLTNTEQSELVHQLVPDLSPQSTHAVVERAQGNPLFIRELLFEWCSADCLDWTEQGLDIRTQAHAALPDRLEEVLDQRLRLLLDRYASTTRDSARTGLQTLALLGPNFSANHTAWALRHTGITLTVLRDQNWLATRPSTREAHYAFTNPLLQQMLVTQAEASGNLDTLIAHCVELRQRAQLAAMIQSDWQTALDNLQMAWQLIERYHQPALRPSLLSAFAHVHYRQRDALGVAHYANQLQHDVHSLKQDPLGTRAAAHLWHGAAALLLREHTQAEHHLRAAITDTPTHNTSVQGQAYQLLGQIALTRRDLEIAQSYLQSAVTLLHQAQHTTHPQSQTTRLRLTEADTIRDLAELHSLSGRHTIAFEHLYRVRPIYTQLGDVQGEAYTWMGLARTRRHQIDAGHTLEADALAHATQHLQRARTLMAKLDDRRGAAILLWEESLQAMTRLDFNAAQALFEQTGHMFRLAQDPRAEALSLNGRAEAFRRLGHYPQAKTGYEAFATASSAMHDPRGQGVAQANLGWLELETKKPDQAHHHFNQALAHFQGPSMAHERVAAHIGNAASYWQQDDWDTLASHLELALLEHAQLHDRDAQTILTQLNEHARRIAAQEIQAQIKALKDIGHDR